MSRRLQLKIKIDSDVTAIDALAESCNLSRSELKKAMNCGAVCLTRSSRKRHRLRRAKQALKTGDVLELYYDKTILDTIPVQPLLLDAAIDYSIWYKPPLLLSQGSDYGDHLSLLRIAEKSLNLKSGPFLVHRLDREASGLILLAHSKKSAASLSEQFRNRSVRKIYRVKVYGMISGRNCTFEVNAPLDGKKASSKFTVVSCDSENQTTDLKVEITTGRYHQIRRHLSSIGYPIYNDCRYAKKNLIQGPLNLCAIELAFKSPLSGERLNYCLPDYLMEF